MQFEHWLAFVVTYTVLSIIPGPSVIMVISQAMSRGKRAAFYCIVGDLLAGVFYLAYLGISQIHNVKNDSKELQFTKRPPKKSQAIMVGFLTGVLNPKAIIFYMAFLSQFMDPAAPIAVQFGILMGTSSLIVGFVLSAYAVFASQARSTFQSATARRRFGYSSGGMLIGSSIYVAAIR